MEIYTNPSHPTLRQSLMQQLLLQTHLLQQSNTFLKHKKGSTSIENAAFVENKN